MKLAIALAAAGCSVPDIDLNGKQCPCADGYVCDTTTQQCVRAGGIDAAVDTAIDGTTSAVSCLGSDPATPPLFTDPFDSLNQWKLAGKWAAVNGEAMSDRTDTYNYAYPDQLKVDDYRVVTTVRQVEHTDTASAYEIAFRIQGTGELVHCNWEPNDHRIVLQHTAAGGTSTTVLVEQTVAVPTSFDPTAPVKLELLVAGTSASCCVREVTGSLLKFDGIPLASGPPGIKTWRMSAAYNDFTAY